MPFLNKAILLELLNTYTGEDLTEKKPQAPKTKIGKWFDYAKKVTKTGYEAVKSTIGVNTKSTPWYFKLRAHIIKATVDENINSWADLIIDAGKAAYQTDSASVWGSKLCCSALALRSYTLNKVNSMLFSINYRRIQFIREEDQCSTQLDNNTLVAQKRGDNIILYWNAIDRINNLTLKMSEVKDLLKRFPIDKDLKESSDQPLIYDLLSKIVSSQSNKKNDLLNPDQILALKIREKLNQKIEEQKKFIENANNNIRQNKSNPNFEFKNLEPNTDEIDYEASSEKMIERRQRNLCYLNAYHLLESPTYQNCSIKKPKALKALVRELFPSFQFYNFSSTELDDETTKKMNPDLPLFLQPNYDSIYLRSKEIDPKKQKYSDERIVSSFEEDVIKNTAADNGRSERSADISLAKSPSSQSLPQRVSVPLLSSLEDKYDDMDSSEIESEAPITQLSYKNVLSNLGTISDMPDELAEESSEFNKEDFSLRIEDNNHFSKGTEQIQSDLNSHEIIPTYDPSVMKAKF